MTVKIIIVPVFCIITIINLNTSAKIVKNNRSIDDTNQEVLTENYYCSPHSKWISFETPDGHLVKNVCITKSYQSDKAPRLSSSVAVSTKAKIIEMDEQERQLTVILDVIAFWEDERIKIALLHRSSFIELPDITRNGRNIWNPFHHLVFPEVNEISLMSDGIIATDIIATSGKVANRLLRNHLFPKDSTVIMADFQWKVKISCNMDFLAYPFDRQTCWVRMFLRKFNISIVEMPWITKEVIREQSHVKGYRLVEKEYAKQINDHRSSGSQSTEFGISIRLTRIFTPYFNLYYIPCIVVVMISFLSFMIPAASSSRIGLLVTQFLSLTTIYIHERSSCPNISDLNLLSYYLLISMFFIFMVILQSSIILLYKRKTTLDRNLSIIKGTQIAEEINELRSAYEMHLICKIDFICFIIACVSYVGFNSIYFVIYLQDI